MKFKNIFKGIFSEPKEFAKEYTEHKYNLPTIIDECVDWEKVWHKLSNEFVAIKVRDDEVDTGGVMETKTMAGVTIYAHAIFQNQKGE